MIDLADGRTRVEDAAALMGLQRRQVYRLLDAFRPSEALIARSQRIRVYRGMALTLDVDWQRKLRTSPYRLRFELNQGGPYVNMFTSSYDRARTLARAALPAEEIIAVVAAFPDPKRELGAKSKGWTKSSAFKILDEMGVPTDPAMATWAGSWWPDDATDDEVEPWVHRAIPVTWEQADVLNWNQVAHDIGVNPQAPVMSKLVDLERGVSVSVYDDRGMDVTALNQSTIADIYSRFDDWLLDYDRPRMAEGFSK